MIARGLSALLLLYASGIGAQTQTPPPPGPMAPVDFPPFQERALASGARLLVVTQNEVPFVTVNLVLRGGSVVDPPGKVGTAVFTSEFLTRGTITRSGDDIAEAIDFMGDSLGASAGTDWITVSLAVLEPDLPEGLALMADVVMNQTFPDQELELVRTRALSGLAASLASPAILASRAFTRALYGSHSYGKLETAGTFQAIDRESLQAFHGSWFHPGNAFFVVAGSAAVDEAVRLLESAFQGWRAGTVPEVEYGAAPDRSSREVILVHQPSSVQAVVRAGHLLGRGDGPDWTALAVATQVLGGGPSARLFRILREEKGWTYGAYSSVTRRRDVGAWQATLEARNEVAGEAVAELLDQMERMRNELVPGSELDVTKSYLVGSFPIAIETPQQIADQVLTDRLLGLPDDALQTYRDRVAALDASDVRKVSTDHLHPDRVVVVVVRDGVVLVDQLAKLGPVTVVDAEGRPIEMDMLFPQPSDEHFDASILRPGVYEYRVMLQGNAVGAMKREFVADTTGGGEAMAFRGTISLGPQTIDQEVVFGVPDFDARSARMVMGIGAQMATMDARVQDGRLIGTVVLPTGSQPVDREVPAGTLIADMVEVAVWIGDLAEGEEI